MTYKWFNILLNHLYKLGENMKVYVRAPYSEECLSELKNMFDEVIYDPWTNTGERFYEDEMLKKLLEIKPDILITELDRITHKVLSGYDGLKLIGDCRSNPANIDIRACTEFNVPVICTPARNAIAVAEYIVGMILMHFRHLPESMEWVKKDKWIKGTTPYYTWMGNEICSKKVGLIGMGAVAKHLAKILSAFGAEISYYDPYIEKIPAYDCKPIEEIFRDSDIVSIHLPVNDETTNMIDKKYFDLMKENSILINSARSQVVNNNDLIGLIKNGSIDAIILDVLPEEPPAKDDIEFIKYDNVYLTPHIAGATYQVTDHQSEILNSRIKEWLNVANLDKIIYNKEIL